MNEVLDVLPGGAIGAPERDEEGELVEGGDTTLHIVVHPRERGSYDTTFKSVLLPRDWESRLGGPNGVVHHETGHAFVDEHLGTKTCDGSAANR